MVEFTSMQLLDYLFTGFKLLAEVLKPYAISALSGVALVFIVKFLFHRFYDFIYFFQTAREQKSAHRRIDNAVDFVSNVVDVISTSKSDKR